ncbi:type I pullulanase [Maribellus maritimus]|uniref:type I pullulanase n=1 Tax=Maribellus maritimus TaxID=2870838 RepID=UPI001EECD8A4|nr:type I pullulanase [Maribellus maritimus]MCG6187320.1 type I pullulanase [Maribellus maritimus]
MREWKFNHIDFSVYPFYEKDDLGVFWTPEKTLVKIWAPTAKIVEFRLYKDGTTGEPFHKTQLQAGSNGTWSTVLLGDYDGKFYTFRINDGEWLEETPDIYARCVGINGLRGMIYNPKKTNPENWENDSSPKLPHYTDAVIYETHVRDFSIAENSGIQSKGKFLGFTEEDTKTTEGIATGLSHLKELGITHVHLLPVYDFFTVDEEKPLEKYNWGYDPLHYNALEGSYSSNPSDGTVRIKEFKKLVQALHTNGIGVVLDVVYNHTYFAKESVFNQTVPGYFYRQKPDGTFSNASGCGNEIASERKMVRKYIIDSLKYWAQEFHIDGFRFDLMGIYDLDTMNEIQQELKKINQGIILYGEGWAADQSPMPEELRAVKFNTPKLPGIASFNDDFRDAIKGNHGNKKSKGFVSGLDLREESIKFGIVGATYHPQIVYDYVEPSRRAWATDPKQCINYASCHDNYTLWDKLKLSQPKASDEELRKMVKLTGALVLTSQGIPFLHSGIEFARSKGGSGNSYKSPDAINQIDWDKKAEYLEVFEYFQNLIQLRKNHPAFRIPSAEQVRKSLTFFSEYHPGTIAYSIDGKLVGDSWEKIVLLFNGTKTERRVQLPQGKFEIIANWYSINENGLGEVENEVMVEGISFMLLKNSEQ